MTAAVPDADTPAIGARVALGRALREAPAVLRGFPLTMVLMALGTAMQIVVPVVMQQMVDGEILAEGGVDGGGVLRLGLVGLAAIVAAAAARRQGLVRMLQASATGLSDLRVAVFRHLHRLSILHVEGERRGALVSRVTADIATIQDFMDFGGVAMILGSLQVVLAVGVMTWYRWQLSLLVLVGVVAYSLLLFWFQRILARAHDRVRRRVADSLAAVGEAISGLPVVRAYGAEDATLARVRRALDGQFLAEFRANRLGAFLFSSAELFAGLITAGVIGVGVWLGAGRGVSAGGLLAFLFLVNLLVEPVQMVVETLDLAQSAGAGVRRILGVLDTAVDVPDPVDGVDLPEGRLDVDFQEVRFRYPTGPDVLSDLTVHLPDGTRVAVVGETGSGKTTFAKLVTRLLDPTEGWVIIGGVPLNRVRFASLRRRVAFVPQEGFLFDTTVRANVRYGKPEATDYEVEAAFAELGLTDWLEQLPAGLDTPVGERGGRLSAGERQLVALVRAWIADPALLVLDEATSAVDPALEVRLRRAIERLTGGRTSITVAHRLSTAEAADEVLVFERGRLVERGRHDDLLARGGAYAALHADWAAGTTND
ncbi:MAG: ABC transporter ATP-binding protein/permease [Acidimicrobiia bacterium]|nr:ABC transporter ATP-binding protein/permease [Acidimicrobiia bacterium]